MMTLAYDPSGNHDGRPIADGDVAWIVNELVHVHATDGNAYYATSNETVLDELRLRVVLGEVPHDQVNIIVYEHRGNDDHALRHELTISHRGVFSKWPESLPDLNGDRITSIVREQVRILKESRITKP
jgi:hypothetical protein